MEITNEWAEITLSAIDWTIIQNTTEYVIIIKTADVLPTDDLNAFELERRDVWTYIHDTEKFYVRGLYIPEGESRNVSIS